MFRNKKGLSAGGWMSAGIGIAGGIMIIAVLAIVLGAFKAATTDPNATLIIGNGQTFLANLSDQLPTVGTVAGVLLLLGLVVAGGMFGYSKMKGE